MPDFRFDVIEICKGSAIVGPGQTVCVPYTDLLHGASCFALWCANFSGTESVNVAFVSSPDRVSADVDTLNWRTIGPGQSVSLTRGDDELRRYWSIVAYSLGATALIYWGVAQRPR